MCSLSTVCVYDDLAACKTSVTVRATDYELTCRVYVKDVVAVEEGSCLRSECLDEHRDEDVLNVLADLLLHLLVNALLAVLSAAVSVAHIAE